MRQATRFGGAALRRAIRTPLRTHSPANRIIARATAATQPIARDAATVCSFHSSVGLRGIMPDAEDPKPPKVEEQEQPTAPTHISTTEFHERADAYLNTLVERLEEAQDNDPSIEVEYSAGVLEVTAQSNQYVLNKQPANKQIWLSSPISGPKRFDWVVLAEGMNHKEGSGVGDWIYLRDGTSLTEVLRKELAVDTGVNDDVPR